MNLLLDTHIWLWAIGEPHRLSKRVSKELDDRKNQLWLSPVSIWESFLLVRKGRINIAPDFETWVANALAAIPVSEAPLTFDVARAFSAVILPHADPADLFLAASARAFNFTLVTADRHLLHAQGISVLPNS